VGVFFFAAMMAVLLFVHQSPPQAVVDETVVVLPGPGGGAGTVVVQRGGERQVLDQPYAMSRIQGDGPPQAARSSDAEVRATFGDTLRALPGRPASFLLYFVVGKDDLTDESRAQLQKILAELKARPVPDVAVIGHTDTVGNDEANDALSLQRAVRVKEYLAGIGIDPARIQVSGRGERELLVRTADNVAEPRNRRVEISVR
jgi:outer membrane protein OmpA-like peptidoglycan-associated protein